MARNDEEKARKAREKEEKARAKEEKARDKARADAADDQSEAVSAVLGTFASVVSGVVGVLKAVPDVLSGALASVTGFVKSFNPGAVEAMDAAFESLYSTVGYALEPIVEGVTDALRTLAGALVEPFTQLRPVISEVTSAMLNVLQPVIHAVGTALRNWMGVLESAMPAVRLFMAALEGAATVYAVLNEIMTTLVTAALQSLFESFGSLTDAADAVKGALASLAVGLARVATWALQLAGQDALGLKIVEALIRPNEQNGRPGAPKDFAISNADDVYRKRLLAAAQAQQGGALTKSESLLDQIRGELVGLRDDLKNNNGRDNANVVRQGALQASDATAGNGLFGPAGWLINRWAQWQEAR